MPSTKRSAGFWIIITFLAVSIALLLIGQTLAVFDYELAVRLGLQESRSEVSEFGVQINRAFGVGDTLVYLPLMLASLAGLLLRKRWSLLTTGAVAGISAYWSVTAAYIFLFLPGTPGYHYSVATEVWVFIGIYAAFGVWLLFYLAVRGDALLR